MRTHQKNRPGYYRTPFYGLGGEGLREERLHLHLGWHAVTEDAVRVVGY